MKRKCPPTFSIPKYIEVGTFKVPDRLDKRKRVPKAMDTHVPLYLVHLRESGCISHKYITFTPVDVQVSSRHHSAHYHHPTPCAVLCCVVSCRAMLYFAVICCAVSCCVCVSVCPCVRVSVCPCVRVCARDASHFQCLARM